MKKFVLVVTLFWMFFFGIIGGIRFSWLHFAPNFMAKNFISPETHTIVLGPSNGLYAWNDSIIPHSRNLCMQGNSLGSCYSMLKRVVECNDSQIDTVVLCASAVAMAYYHDGIKNYLLKHHDEDIRNIFNQDVFFEHYKNEPEYWKIAFTTIPIRSYKLGVEGCYSYLERDKLDHPHLYDSFNEVMELAGGGKDDVTEGFLREHCKYQIDNLLLIKHYCDEHGKTLILLTPPVYKIPDMMSDKGYYELICHELGDSTLVADYSRMNLPKNYYADLEHVNFRGARVFSEEIARDGLKVEYAIDYCK